MRVRDGISGTTIGLSAFLLFAVEPLSSKDLLPKMGGSSAVWLSCLCFFQIVLLLGYLYAAVLTSVVERRLAQQLHLGMLVAALGWVLLRLHGWSDVLVVPGSSPTWTIFRLLGLQLGLPFLVLSATSPLLQVWLAQWSGSSVRFRLFALSNAGSMAALLAYPTLIEPHLPLHLQREAWAAAFGVYALLCSWLTLETLQVKVPATSSPIEPQAVPATSRRGRFWICFLLGSVGTIQLCTVTAHLTENVAALPLLWIVPLGVYLLSFVVAFELPRIYRRDLVLRLVVVLLASLGYLLSKTDVSLPLGLAVGIFLAELFLACWFCHAEVYAVRPSRPVETAWFYLVLAGGGATGTILSVIVAPIVFNANYDLPVGFAMTAATALVVTWQEGWSRRLLWGTCSVLCLTLTWRLHAAFARNTIFLTRNFYGSVRVKHSELPVQAESSRLLLNGTIQHGMQWFSPQFRTEPLTYYGRQSGAGLALGLYSSQEPRRIGVIGLGAGTVAAYGKAGDTMRFYEINPAVEQVAKEFFTYLRESEAKVTLVDGDARQSLEQERDVSFDVLVVDAFSGDAIPVHLLTVEAMQLYQRHLRRNGVLAFHISNQYVNLAPVLGALAAHEGLTARVVDSSADAAAGLFAARWVLVAPAGAPIFATGNGGPGELLPRALSPAWTDDYSSLVPVVRWGGSGR